MEERSESRALVRKWQALCHEVIGLMGGLEDQLDRALALGHARDQASADRLYHHVFHRVPLDAKLAMLPGVLAVGHDPITGLRADVLLPFCEPGLRQVHSMRNVMAHSEVLADSTPTEVHLLGRWRGGWKEHKYPLLSVAYVRGPLGVALSNDLEALARWAAPRV